tara:strand:- start:590 stop:1072 length:483 start_codon:yes stop_codon:yes gene_type:complete
MDWLDDLYDKASNLVSKADANDLFGINEAGLFNDIGLIDDLKKTALGKALRGVNADTSGAGINKNRKPMYGSTDPAEIPPDEEPTPVEEEIRNPFQSSDYQMNLPPRIETPIYNVPTREVGMIGSKPNLYGRKRMVLDDGSEEEERKIIAAILRRNQGYG